MIRHIYVVHHSHTDIGYTDLQERIVENQAEYIQQAVSCTDKEFRWNCETYYCVEQFFARASSEEKERFFSMIKEGTLGISASYLNFNDLLDARIINKRTKEMVNLFTQHDIQLTTAMIADINGISSGAYNAYVDNGIEFLYTNIHTHHGMYPLYQNMNAYKWKREDGKILYVWNGEHYNLGNALGFVPNRSANFMTQSYFGGIGQQDPIARAKDNLDNYLRELEAYDYPHDFVPVSVSGVFSDNAPPNFSIPSTLQALEELYNGELSIKMVSLQELYSAIKPTLEQAPEYQGDLTDWWAHGVGSTPYAVKHYRAAQRAGRLVRALDTNKAAVDAELEKSYEDNMLLYAEHTWGHSATIDNPYDTFVLDLDLRKTSYASKAHEAANKNLLKILRAEGDVMRYYGREGQIKVINPGGAAERLVEFYLEVMGFEDVQVTNIHSNRTIDAQVSAHPRGVLISFIDSFEKGEEKYYDFCETAKQKDPDTSRIAYRGAERVRDIVNGFDPVSYRHPYEVETPYFKLTYNLNEGVTGLYDKKRDINLSGDSLHRAFTPIYENTERRKGAYEERRLLGRNIRGIHAKQYEADLLDVKINSEGSIFTALTLVFELEGTKGCSVDIKLFHTVPRIDYSVKIAKTLSTDVESIYLPLVKKDKQRALYIDKGGLPFKAAVEQIPGTCMEYYLIDNGVSFVDEKGSLAISSLDVPLVSLGELEHHPIRLCENREEDNRQTAYSWIMNNCWETNFKMDLSGFCEYQYSLTRYDSCNQEEVFRAMQEQSLGTVVVMVENAWQK